MPDVLEAFHRKLVLFTRLLQKELGMIPCALVRHTMYIQLTRLLMILQPEHKAIHKSNAPYNPFPTFSFTGTLRPSYPLSPRRTVPKSIPHPNYADDADPKYRFVGRNTIRTLDEKAQDGMRRVCRLAREVLDLAAREIKLGVTTDYIDEVVHKACIERNVGPGITRSARRNDGSLIDSHIHQP